MPRGSSPHGPINQTWEYPDSKWKVDFDNVVEAADKLTETYHLTNEPPVELERVIEGMQYVFNLTDLEYPIVATADRQAQAFTLTSNEKTKAELGGNSEAWNNLALAYLIGRLNLTYEQKAYFAVDLLDCGKKVTKERVAALQFAALVQIPDKVLRSNPEPYYNMINMPPGTFQEKYGVLDEICDIRRELLSEDERSYILTRAEREDYMKDYLAPIALMFYVGTVAPPPQTQS